VGWDASRPVPYQRLLKEWAIYAAIMGAVVLVLLRDRNPVGLMVGLVASLPLYIGLSAAMAKLGYQRKTLAELRTPRASTSSTTGSSKTGSSRPAPKPTKRTNGPSKRR
jgi:hypothetical protein